MKFKLIYPRWPKLMRQTEFHLPPHGPVVFAATLPPDVEVEFVDENLESLDLDAPADVVGISMMLTAQVKRGWAIADLYRAKGVPVIFGGIATMLHAKETLNHADAVFLGEAEGRMEQVLADLKAGRLKKRYDYLTEPPPVELVGPARRDILKRGLYNYRGIQMVDLVHASRGCRYNCYPCCVAYLGGAAIPAPPHRQGGGRDGGHRQQPPLYRGQLPGPGHPLGDGPVQGDDPVEKKMVLPSHRGRPQGTGSGSPGRRLVRLPGGVRHLGQDPGADQALP